METLEESASLQSRLQGGRRPEMIFFGWGGSGRCFGAAAWALHSVVGGTSDYKIACWAALLLAFGVWRQL